MKTIFSSIIISMLLLFACCNEQHDKTSGTGIVIHMSLEGGFYGLITDGGDHYLPENLAADFQKDSLRVSFECIITDRPTTAQWGRTITLTKIERIP
jgi:hypothetical protein